jgi:hypothetical protein
VRTSAGWGSATRSCVDASTERMRASADFMGDSSAGAARIGGREASRGS